MSKRALPAQLWSVEKCIWHVFLSISFVCVNGEGNVRKYCSLQSSKAPWTFWKNFPIFFCFRDCLFSVRHLLYVWTSLFYKIQHLSILRSAHKTCKWDFFQSVTTIRNKHNIFTFRYLAPYAAFVYYIFLCMELEHAFTLWTSLETYWMVFSLNT